MMTNYYYHNGSSRKSATSYCPNSIRPQPMLQLKGNAPYPILLTLEGTLRVSNDVHKSKALLPIFVTVFGIITDDKDEHK